MTLRYGGECRCGEDGKPVEHGPEARDKILAEIRLKKQKALEDEQEEAE